MEQEVMKKFEDIECELSKQSEKIEKIEDRVYSTETNIQLINVNIDNLMDNTNEIKADIKDLVKKREDDHFIKPLEKTEKLKYQVLYVLAGFLLSNLLIALFPHLTTN